jgi:hypothetical protein
MKIIIHTLKGIRNELEVNGIPKKLEEKLLMKYYNFCSDTIIYYDLETDFDTYDEGEWINYKRTKLIDEII